LEEFSKTFWCKKKRAVSKGLAKENSHKNDVRLPLGLYSSKVVRLARMQGESEKEKKAGQQETRV